MSAKPSLGTPISDVAVHYPQLSEIRPIARSLDWPRLSLVVEELDPELQYHAANLAGSVMSKQGATQLLAQTGEPGGMARVLAAAAYVDSGWKIRTGARSDDVSEEQFRQFHEHLRLAEQQLIEATALNPANAAAWALRITTARGLQLGPNEAKRRYAQLAKHHPHHFAAQAQLLQQLCPKWGGTWAEVHAFASECTQQAPEGAVNGGLVPLAHIEHWAELDAGADLQYLTQGSVFREVRLAAARSVWHTSARSGAPGWVNAHSAFAAFWCLADEHVAAAPHFRALGDHYSELPWSYIGNSGSAAAFAEHRAYALSKG